MKWNSTELLPDMTVVGQDYSESNLLLLLVDVTGAPDEIFPVVGKCVIKKGKIRWISESSFSSVLYWTEITFPIEILPQKN